MERVREIIAEICDDNYDEILEDYINAYNECFDNDDYSNNIYLTESGSGLENCIFFTFPNTTDIYMCDMMNVTFEKVSNRCKLEVGQEILGDFEDLGQCQYESLKLSPNSSSDFSYILYSFDQGRELPIVCLKVDENTRSDWVNIYSNYEVPQMHNIKWTDELNVEFNDNYYKILKNNKTVSTLHNGDDFQLGDSNTEAYIDQHNNLLICNYGDVSSAIIISQKK